MKFGLFVDQDTTRYSYLRLRRLKAAVKDAQIVDALVEELEVPGATGKKKLAAITRRIEELRGTKGSLWHEVAALEVLAASIFAARKRIGGIVAELFKQVPRVQDLSAPLAGWLNIAGLTPYPGGVPGIGRANLIGYRGGQFMSRGRIVGIEATNDASQLDHALREMKTSREHTHASYIACTPALAAEFLWAQASASAVPHWDANTLRRRLLASGCGLLLVEGDAVAQVHLPKERQPDSAMLTELGVAVQSAGKRDK